jgi:hypothetical protein
MATHLSLDPDLGHHDLHQGLALRKLSIPQGPLDALE